MILHVVLFEPRATLADSERQAVLDALQSAAEGIPAVRSLRIGRRVRHGLPGYEEAMRTNFEYALLVECADLAGLRSYLEHPLHLEFGRHFTESAAAGLAYDFEMIDVDDLRAAPAPADAEETGMP